MTRGQTMTAAESFAVEVDADELLSIQTGTVDIVQLISMKLITAVIRDV